MNRVNGTMCVHRGNVWTHENRISSDGEVKEVCLSGLPLNALELNGIFIKVDGKIKTNGVFSYRPFKPESKITNYGFDQVVLYHSLQSVSNYLGSLGFDIPKVVAKRRGKSFKIKAHAHGTTSFNAWYSPQKGDLTFGTHSGKWHLASDSDISTHEMGHLILDHYRPGLTGWFAKEGGAIHEGFADALAAGYADDPEMSEDFVPHKGRPESKDDGLRDVDNRLRLSDVSKEVHDRGRVYGGFFWSIKKALSDPSGKFRLSSRRAADLMLRILVNHASCYRTKRPSSKDFVDAVLAGVTGLAKRGKLGVDQKLLKQEILWEAIKRQFVKPSENENPPTVSYGSVAKVEEVLSKRGYNIRFQKDHSSRYIGGFSESYRQQVMTKRFGYIDIVGCGILLQRNRYGRIISLSVKDVRKIKSGNIDTSGKVTPDEAIRNALIKAKRNYRRAKGRMGYLGRGRLSRYQMELEIAKRSIKNLNKMRRATKKYKIVLIDGSRVPHYEFMAGLAIYYVNTKTGSVIRYKDVVVN